MVDIDNNPTTTRRRRRRRFEIESLFVVPVGFFAGYRPY